MRWQGVANAMVRGLLRTPVLCRVAGNRLITMYIRGRRSGRTYIVPVAYTPLNDVLVVGTPFGWGKNLRTGEQVDIRLKGRRKPAEVTVFTDEVGVGERYALMARDNKSFAAFNNIGFDAAGNPEPADLRAAWAAGARAFELTVR